MMLDYCTLESKPSAFRSFTGFFVREFESLLEELLPLYDVHYRAGLERPDRQRAIGGGRWPELEAREQILLTVIWLRLYPTQEVLGFLFGVSDTNVSRTVERILPLLEATGRNTLRPPSTRSRQRGRSLEAVLQDVPELAVIIDSFEQAVQRPKRLPEGDKSDKSDKSDKGDKAKKRKDAYYSGKKKQHTLKSQVAVNRHNGTLADVSQSVPGPTADLKLLQHSGLLQRLEPEVGAWGDLAYLGMDKGHPQGLGATPRRKPKGRDRPPQDIEFNHAFASHRIQVEHTIGRLRRYQSLKQTDRHHRRNHTPRVVAVAGLVNRQILARFPGLA
jgi:hypothetical protein